MQIFNRFVCSAGVKDMRTSPNKTGSKNTRIVYDNYKFTTIKKGSFMNMLHLITLTQTLY